MSDPAPVPEPAAPWLRPELVASWREIAGVLAVVVGLFIFRSTWAIFHGSDAHYVNLIMSQETLMRGIITEGLMLAVFLGYLHFRGWKPVDFKIHLDVKGTLQAPLLIICAVAGNFVIVITTILVLYLLQHQEKTLFAFLLSRTPTIAPHSIDFTWTALLVGMILNAFFEELTCTGYMFNQFAAKRGPLFALVLTVLLRMGCHTYQGLEHVLGIGVAFSIFGLWYWRTRNLWILIFGHMLMDIAAGCAIKAIGG